MANKWLRNFTQKLNRLRAELDVQYPHATFLFLRKYKQSFYLTTSRSVSEIFFQELGMHSAYGKSVAGGEIKLENILAMDPDHIMLMVCQEQETLYDWNKLQLSTDWMKLKAAKENNIHCISTDPWFEYSAVAHERILEQVRELLIE